jgi:septal ring factor EnvC (AmiA/AmiB activator)
MVVRAAEDGIVKLAGEVDKLSKLGNIVIIYHRNDIATVYANVEDVSVSEEDEVHKSQKIGTVDSSTSKDKATCYFEIRYKLEPRDPLIFLGEPA